MFEWWHNLDAAGKTTSSEMPRNPLSAALLWRYQDGYLAGGLVWVQHMVFGGLARLGRLLGHEARRTRAEPARST